MDMEDAPIPEPIDGPPVTRPAMEAPKKEELEEETALLQPPKPAAGCTATVRLAPRSGAVKFRTDLAKKAAAAATAAAAPTVPAAAFKSERPE